MNPQLMTTAGYPRSRPSAWLPGLPEGRAGYVPARHAGLVVGSVRGGASVTSDAGIVASSV